MEDPTKTTEAVVKTPEEIAADKKVKADAKKAAKEAEKAAKQAKKDEREAAQKAAIAAKDTFVKDENDTCAHLFGDLELNRSQCDPEERFTKKYVAVKDIADEHVGQSIRIRGRIHNSRAKGKMCFCVIREGFATVQVVLAVCDTVSKGMVTYASKIPKESIVEVVAKVIKPDQPIAGCSQQLDL